MFPTHSITVHQKDPKREATGVFKAQEECVSSIQVNHALSTNMKRNNSTYVKCSYSPQNITKSHAQHVLGQHML